MESNSLLIVGAGPTGLLLAIWLKTLCPQVSLRIVDKSNGPCENSRAIVVHARTLEFYRQLGLSDQFKREGKILEGIEIFRSGRRRGTLRFGEVAPGQSHFPYVLTFPQDEHQQLLLRRLDELGVKVEWSTKLQGLEAKDTENIAKFEDGTTASFDWVAGCDGFGSSVRDLINVNMEGAKYESRFFVADVDLNATHADIPGMQMHIGDELFVICLPLGEGHFRLLGQIPPTMHAEASFEDLRDHVDTTIAQDIAEVHWASIYRISHGVAQRFRQQRVFLVGDAAHVHSPVGGQGMNTGLGDATNLAWKLAGVINGKLKPDILDTYQLERRPFAEILVKTTDKVFTYFTDLGWTGWFFRNVVFAWIVPALWAYTSMPRLVFRMVSQTALTYRDQLSRSVTNPRAADLQPGDRLPYVQFAEFDNHAAFESCDWQVHVYRTVTEDKVRGKLYCFPIHVFPWNTVARLKGLQRDVHYLIRPDGHIAALQSASSDVDGDSSDLMRYVQAWFQR